jgi:hypothetical protein
MPGFVKDMMGSGLTGPQAQAINGNVQLGQTATGSTQGTAFPLQFSGTEFTTVAASTGAVLPGTGFRLNPADILAVYNQGANALSVYPPVGGRIGLAAVNAAVSVASGNAALFVVRGDGNYFRLLSA